MIYVIHAAIILSATAVALFWWSRKCKHEWAVLKVIRVWNKDVSGSMPVATKYVMQCKKCGAIKKKEV